MKYLERWINGDSDRKLVAFKEGDTVIVSEVTTTCEGPGTHPSVYRRDRLTLTHEEAQWLSWALDQRGALGNVISRFAVGGVHFGHA